MTPFPPTVAPHDARCWSDAAIRHDPLGFVDFRRTRMRGLAELLERIADALPQGPGPAALVLAAARLRRCAAGGDLHERALYALAARRLTADPTAHAVLEIARREAEAGAAQAIDLADALEQFAHHGRAEAPEALGFMLRGCFEGLRRREDWLGSVVLPRFAARMTQEDVARLGERLAAAAAALPAAAREGFAVVQGGRA